jgi:hypothetical protein
MLNSTDASTWAFNNQEKQGQTGSFTPKPNKNNNPTISGNPPSCFSIARVEGAPKAVKTAPSNKQMLPPSVQKNISATASPIRSDLEVSLSRYKDTSKSSSKDTSHSNKVEAYTKAKPTAHRTLRAENPATNVLTGRVSNKKQKKKLGTMQAKSKLCFHKRSTAPKKGKPRDRPHPDASFWPR